jgi:ABC-type multidrug transport system permease subunit
MKNLVNILAIVGFLLVALAIVGRFYGPPTVLGRFQASSTLVVANTCLLAALVINALKK